MIVYADDRYRLEALGLGDDVSPLVLQASCQRCQQLLHERIYRIEEAPPLEVEVAAHATLDAVRALAHVCLAP